MVMQNAHHRSSFCGTERAAYLKVGSTALR